MLAWGAEGRAFESSRHDCRQAAIEQVNRRTETTLVTREAPNRRDSRSPAVSSPLSTFMAFALEKLVVSPSAVDFPNPVSADRCPSPSLHVQSHVAHGTRNQRSDSDPPHSALAL